MLVNNGDIISEPFVPVHHAKDYDVDESKKVEEMDKV